MPSSRAAGSPAATADQPVADTTVPAGNGAASPAVAPAALAGVLGHGASDKRIDILARIAESGSISEAARRCGVSYKAAWQALETLHNLAGVPLVRKAVGGSGGGGAALTAAGEQVLAVARELERVRAQVLSAAALPDRVAAQAAPSTAAPTRSDVVASATANPTNVSDVSDVTDVTDVSDVSDVSDVASVTDVADTADAADARRPSTGTARAPAPSVGLAALALRTSLRNQFPCTVQAVRAQRGQVLVRLRTAGGDLLDSLITRESAQLLGLQPGLPVLALFKATAVRIGAQAPVDDEGVNHLPGTVTRVARGAGAGDITLALAGGIHVVGFAASPAYGPRLRRGARAEATVEASAVVIARAA